MAQSASCPYPDGRPSAGFYLSQWWESETHSLQTLRQAMQGQEQPRLAYLYLA